MRVAAYHIACFALKHPNRVAQKCRAKVTGGRCNNCGGKLVAGDIITWIKLAETQQQQV